MKGGFHLLQSQGHSQSSKSTHHLVKIWINTLCFWFQFRLYLTSKPALNNLANVLNYILLHRYFTFKKSCQILVNKGERKLPWKKFRQFDYTSRGCPEFTFSKNWGICQVIIKREETLTSVYPSPLSSNAWSRKVKMALHWVYDTLNT